MVLTSCAVEASNGFYSLEALLQSVSDAYIHDEVRPRPPLQTHVCLTALQESGAVRNKIEVLLSRITSLGTLFSNPPENVGDQRRRTELIWHVVFLRLRE